MFACISWTINGIYKKPLALGPSRGKRSLSVFILGGGKLLSSYIDINTYIMTTTAAAAAAAIMQ
jgi:hypothetical protein